jgi:regulator of protease activity HflC (stomatin/prohibitin superfamily)
MRAERDRRAAVLTAEGVKQSQILTAEGEKQSAILRAEGSAQAAILNAQGEARAISQVFDAIHRGDPDQKLLAYQYLQMLPQIAQGDANKLWIIPSEIGDALKGLGGALGKALPDLERASSARSGPDLPDEAEFEAPTLQDPNEALAEARRDAAGATAEAEGAATLGAHQGMPAAPTGGEVAPVTPPPPPVAPQG